MSAPTKARCVPCDGRGCDECSGRGWVLVALTMDCPRCEGSEEVEGSVRAPADGLAPFRPYETSHGLVRCPDCRGKGTVSVPCYAIGCDRPAVREGEDEPACEVHDLCDLCGQVPPVLGEQHCARCARHLAAVVAPSAAA